MLNICLWTTVIVAMSERCTYKVDVFGSETVSFQSDNIERLHNVPTIYSLRDPMLYNPIRFVSICCLGMLIWGYPCVN